MELVVKTSGPNDMIPLRFNCISIEITLLGPLRVIFS